MNQLIKLQEKAELVPTKNFPLASFAFEYFNPIQTTILDVYRNDNCIIAASTSAGKTAIAEIFLSHEIRVNKKKGIYLSPQKSLSQERINDWLSPNHHFSDLKVAILTGDYRTKDDRKKADEADLVIMTSEMLNSVGRSGNNKLLRDVGVVAVDEVHMLSDDSRGSHTEAGIMKFAEINPEGRFLLLSATMPNVDEIGRWICSLTNKNTNLLISNYRPCKLNVHYEKYQESKWGYEENEQEKVAQTIKILKKYPSDKFICFVHTKKTGELLWKAIKSAGIEYDYHNADLSKEKRISIENRFREDPKLRVLVATSGLAQGLNMPARRVVVLGVHRGLKEVKNYELWQAAGRAGRPKYDKEGDAHILLPYKNFARWMQWVNTPEPIKSQICDPKILAFHIISEIHHGNIRNMDDIHDWYSRTLAAFQKKLLDEDVVDGVISKLVRSGCLMEEDGNFKVTSTGVIASMFYYSPYDVADIYRNFGKIFERNKEDYDTWVAMALGSIESHRMGIVTSAERPEIDNFRGEVEEVEVPFTGKNGFTDGAIKAGYCYHMMLNGKCTPAMTSMMRGLQTDSGRIMEVLTALNTMTGKWDKADWIKKLNLRVTYGVGEELVEIIALRGIGKVKAKRLWAEGLRTLKEVSENPVRVIKALNCNKDKANEICQEAKDLL